MAGSIVCSTDTLPRGVQRFIGKDVRVEDGLFGRNGSTGGSRRRPLAPIATLVDLWRVGGLFDARDLRTLAEALDDPEVVAALGVTDSEIEDIRRRSDTANS